jgi:glycogen(starch) synthase
MRVLFWTELFWPYVGGVEVLSAQFIRLMRERGYEFAVVTSHGSLKLPDEDRYEDTPVHRFPFLKALSEKDIGQIAAARRRLVRLKEAFAPDLVHVHFTDPSILFHIQTADAHPAPSLVSIRVGLPDRGGPDTLVGCALRSADWVTANSAAMLAHARRLVPEITSRSCVIYNGLPGPSVALAPLPTDPPVVLCLGRIVRDKGFDLAVEALAAVGRRIPAVRLLIAGDGPERPALERQAQELGIADAVRFAGWVSPEAVPALINEATLVVMPSRWEEAFGLVALQAAQMGRPVVATRVGGLPEVVLHGETGLVVGKEDGAALAEAILFLLEHPDEAARLGEAARRRAADAFSMERYLDQHDALYRRLIKEVAHVGPA